MRAPLRLRWALLSFTFLASLASWSHGEPATAADSVRVDGVVIKPQTWTADRLKEALAGQIKKVEYSSKGQKHVWTCVPLLAVVEAAQPPTDPKHKNASLRLAVVVQASDNYAVTFGMGELLPELGNREAWLALQMDGQPLTGRDAPMKLIVPGDAKASRGVWGVSRISVVDPLPPSDKKPG